MKRRMLQFFAVLAFSTSLFTLTSCGSSDAAAPGDNSEAATPVNGGNSENEVTDTNAVGSRDSTPIILTTTADGSNLLEGNASQIDLSNTSKGYIMVKYTGSAEKVKAQLTFQGSEPYTYDLTPGDDYAAFPITSGNGSYTLTINENIADTKYAVVDTAAFDVALEDELLPFLHPSQYVNYTADSEAVALGAELAKSANSDLEALENIYNYVIGNVTYDFELAENVKTFYIPDIDTTLNTGKGICFDYAVLMTAMLRTQGIPTQLVLGYAGEAYHAWISVYTDETGWISNVIEFDGNDWVLMDPTFASTNSNSPDILEYIGDGKNYNALYFY